MGPARAIWFLVVGPIILCGFFVLYFFLDDWKSTLVPHECSRATQCAEIFGPLSRDHLARIKSFEDLSIVVVNSPGGEAGLASQISKVLEPHSPTIVVVGQCSSACFEYLLPTASVVRAYGRPVIAIHGHAHLYQNLFEERGFDRPSSCDWPSLDWLDYLYEKKGLSAEFSIAAKQRLGEIDFSFTTNDDGCPRNIKLKYEHPYWFPTSRQIKDLLGIEIVGSICADSFSDCASRISNSSDRTCYIGNQPTAC